MEMDEIIFALKETVRELNPGVLFVPKYGGELIELIPNNEKSRIGGIFTYSEHVTLEFSQGFRDGFRAWVFGGKWKISKAYQI